MSLVARSIFRTSSVHVGIDKSGGLFVVVVGDWDGLSLGFPSNVSSFSMAASLSWRILLSGNSGLVFVRTVGSNLGESNFMAFLLKALVLLFILSVMIWILSGCLGVVAVVGSISWLVPRPRLKDSDSLSSASLDPE